MWASVTPFSWFPKILDIYIFSNKCYNHKPTIILICINNTVFKISYTDSLHKKY